MLDVFESASHPSLERRHNWCFPHSCCIRKARWYRCHHPRVFYRHVCNCRRSVRLGDHDMLVTGIFCFRHWPGSSPKASLRSRCYPFLTRCYLHLLTRLTLALGPILIGIALGLCTFATGAVKTGYAGASMNPARCFGLMAAEGRWRLHWVHWTGAILAGIINGLFYWLIPPSKPRKI